MRPEPEKGSCRWEMTDMLLKRFLKEECGATAIEYALIATVISLAIISGVGSIASEVRTIFSSTAENF